MVCYCKILLALALMMAIPVAVSAQTTDKAPASNVPVSQPTPTVELLKPEQLEALVAPIALYPDELLANVLAASTYPLEVVQADRWLKERKSLKGDGLKTALDKQSWDDSIKALVGTSDVLTMMSNKIDWTKGLGDAVLAQQPDVMDAIQRLRMKAYDGKKLATTKQQKVSVKTQESKQVIVIEQANPATVYVPYYDPATVYGTWPYVDYPPYYFGYPSYIGAGAVAAGIAFGTAWAIGRWGNYWGGGFNWGNRNVYVNHRTTNVGNGWQHNPAHRQGVRYNNTNVEQRFGNTNLKAGAANRMDFRGRDGQQVLRPSQGAGDRAGDRGGDRAGTRDRPGGGDRAGVADRAKSGGDRAISGNRAKGGGDRAKAANRGGAGAAHRGGGGGNRGGAMNVSSGRAAAAASARGRSSMASMPRGGGGASFAGGRGGGGGGGGFHGGGGGGFRGGGGGGGGRGGGGGGRRSDIALKHDVVLLGHLTNGLGYYRFSYLGGQKAYVGVMAQEVQGVAPDAVTRGSDGYLRVYYEKLGLTFRTYSDWLSSGAKIPGEVLP